MPSGTPRTTTGSALVLGGGIAGIQCALDLAEGGYKVYLVEKSPALGGHMAQLDKTFPTNDCAMCTLAPKLVEVGRHLNVEIVTNSELVGLEGEPGNFDAIIHKYARYVDPAKCTSCGECIDKCPVSVKNHYNEDLNDRRAIFKLYPQAIPSTYAITKNGHSPCKRACAVHTSAQGYVALIGEGRFDAAYTCASDPNPFVAVCGRICTHECETDCIRGEVDEAISIAGLKRFVADWAVDNLPMPEPAEVQFKEKVAIIGAGPAGMTAARDLAMLGYQTTVFESKPEAGGMLRFGIPESRLPKAALQQDIDRILALGVDLQLGKTAGRDFTVDSLLQNGYSAVFLATGLQGGAPVRVPGFEAKGVVTAIDVLLDVALEKSVEVGEKVVVVGGGDVAFDAARTAIRLQALAGCEPNVTLVYRRTQEEMPARHEEVEEAREEGLRIELLVTPLQILTSPPSGGRPENDAAGAGSPAVDTPGGVAGIRLQRCKLGDPDESGRRRPVPLEGQEFELPADTVIYAVGQSLVPDFLQGCEGVTCNGDALVIDRATMMTNRPAVFAGGDVAPDKSLTAIEAVAAGRRAARSIHNYLRGEKLTEVWEESLPEAKPEPEELEATEPQPRTMQALADAQQRRRSWEEVKKGFTEEQAVAEAKRCLNCAVCSECMECVRACGVDAVIHDDVDKEYPLPVGAVVMATGYDAYDPGENSQWGYRRYPNVFAALEYERLLSSSGPTAGEIVRPSDGTHPERIAFIQCVGSRDQDHEYCSSVCCMYANKLAMMTIDHVPEARPDVFLMDMRAQGKGFDQVWERSKALGVSFIHSRPSTIKEDPATKDLLITWEDEAGELHTDRYDMVVLSVGLEPSRNAQAAAGHLGIALNRHGFCELQEYAPLATTREGVFVVGAFGEPKDIPESVAQASATASRVMTQLADSRGTLTVEREYPAERDISDEAPRVGVFVCHCGSNIAGVVDVESVADYAAQLPGVEFATHTMYTCSTDSCSQITEMIKEHNLNRVVVASCTPRTHEPIFQDTLREAGLNPYLFEMANIRDQCSWVHGNCPADATEKAKDLVRMSVARSMLLEPLYKVDVPLTHAAVVIGGGLAGMTAALALGDMGYETHLIERSDKLGGRVLEIDQTIKGTDPAEFVATLEKRLIDNPQVKIHLESELADLQGFIGNYNSMIRESDGKRTPVEHGVVILATGAQEWRPELFGLGDNPEIVTGLDLEKMLADDDPRIKEAGAVGFLLCAGSLDPENKTYCSRTCCQQSVKNAIRLKEADPDRPVYVWYKEMRTYGFLEEYYTKARELGVIFARYDNEAKPRVSADMDGGLVKVTWNEKAFAGKPMEVPLDLLVLATPTVPNEGNEDLSKLLKVPITADGFFLEAHVKLRPVDFASEGLFLCGSAHYPKSIDETISQAYAAAGRAAAILNKPVLKAGGVVAEVDQETCAACLTCVRICPYEVPRIDPEAKKAYIEPAACQGCGVCVSECPAKAIELHHYSDSQIIAKEEALFLTEADIAAGVALDASTPFPKSDAGQPSGEVS